jgi:hypothetical protein
MNTNNQSVPDRADVIDAYTVMLGRQPESEEVIANHMRATSIKELVGNVAHSPEFLNRVALHAEQPSPFLYVNASVDVRAIVRANIKHGRTPKEGYNVNFLGVSVPIAAFHYLHDKGGMLDHVPIPANYHADMAEWAAAIRAIDLARDNFVMIELGCGWGCWMVNTGFTAKGRGLRVRLLGVEGDPKHVDLAHQTMAANGIDRSEYSVTRGIAAGGPGYALFPKHKEGEEHWGFEPIFGKSLAESEAAVASGKFESLKMIPLAEVIGDHKMVDLLHMDIQGGEADLVAATLDLLTEKVGYILIGTHSRVIEGRLMKLLLDAGWLLEIERPAIFNLPGGVPQTTVDGVQGWKNPKFHGG